MSYTSTILSQVIKECNNYFFENQVKKYNGDRKTKVIGCSELLKIMIFSQLSDQKFTRDIVTGLKSAKSDYYHLGFNKEIKRSTLSYALGKRPNQVFEDFYYSMLGKLSRKEKRRFGRKVSLIDSTTIGLCLEKFDWAEFRKTKAGIKLHTLIDYDLLVAEKIIITNAKVHDIKGVRNNITFKPGEFYVMDRGYASYKYLYDIHLQKSFFVTRIKKNWKVEKTTSREFDSSTGILADDNIKVVGLKEDEYPEELRRVTFYHKESGKTLKFITNNFEVATDEISDLYKSRWQIELFFKWIKQHLRIKSFYSTSKNGVLIQIWSVLITYLLMVIIKRKYSIEKNIYEILRQIRCFVLKRVDIYHLLSDSFEKGEPPDYDKKHGQLELKFA